MILGQFAGGPAVRTDYNQTDPSKADYLVGRENIAPKTHVEDKNNPHGVTIEQIGAAPSGYGLGGNAATIDNLNSLISGIYKWEAAAENRPFDYGTAIVLGRDGSSGAEICIGVTGTYKGVIVVRTKNSAGWIEEFVNPPMVVGAEYRTTERWEGKPVYVQLVNFGTMPNNTNKGITVPYSGTKPTKMVYVEGIARHSGGATHVALGDHGAISIVAEIYSGGISLTLQTTTDFSSWTATILLKYIK